MRPVGDPRLGWRLLRRAGTSDDGFAGGAAPAESETGGGGRSARGSSRRREAERSKSGLVVSRLRAALEEERQALLAQAEALHLAIDDEHDYRGRVEQPPPSLTSLLELKRSLQAVLSQTDSAAALTSHVATGGTARRGDLSAYGRALPAVGAAIDD